MSVASKLAGMIKTAKSVAECIGESLQSGDEQNTNRQTQYIADYESDQNEMWAQRLQVAREVERQEFAGLTEDERQEMRNRRFFENAKLANKIETDENGIVVSMKVKP